jgi:TPR repeat protein
MFERLKIGLLATSLGLSLLMTSSGACFGQDFNKGLAAYDRGDFAAALGEWRILAEWGDARAQSNLAIMYEAGIGVSKDYFEAFKLWRLVAEQGDRMGQWKFGIMYEQGRGVITDFTAALMWYEISAMDGNVAALVLRDVLKEKMSAGDISKAQELARACLAKKYKGC